MTPRLKRIDLMRTTNDGHGWHGHPDIHQGRYYLAKIDDGYFAGTFSRVWFGWTFHGWINRVGLQLDKPGENNSQWRALWEIVE